MSKSKQKSTYRSAPQIIQDLSVIIDQVADHVMITDKEGIVEYVNPAFEKTTGYSKKDILGKTPKILQSGQQSKKYYKTLWDTILVGKVFHAQTTNKKKNGEFYVADQTISPIADDSGEITHFVSIWKDITERVTAEENLRKLNDKIKFERNKLEQVLDIEAGLNTILHLDKLVDYVIDKTAKILEAEKCSLMFVDKHAGELIIKGSKGLNDEAVSKSRIKIGEPIAGLIAQEGKAVLVKDIEADERFLRKKRAAYKTKSFMSAPLKLGDNLMGIINVADKNSLDGNIFLNVDLKILAMIAHQAAVAIENAKLYRQLKFLTITDPITNMHNYRHFAQTLDYEIKRLKRLGGDLCLIMFDIDDFKSYNDTFGHIQGDVLLKEISYILKQNIREADTACRYAGDEFVVILPGTKIAGAEVIANKIRSVIASHSFKRKVTVSIGVANCLSNLNRYELVQRVDVALYEAKKKGKNQIYVCG